MNVIRAQWHGQVREHSDVAPAAGGRPYRLGHDHPGGKLPLPLDSGTSPTGHLGTAPCIDWHFGHPDAPHAPRYTAETIVTCHRNLTTYPCGGFIQTSFL